jgi:hypothetical protein
LPWRPHHPGNTRYAAPPCAGVSSPRLEGPDQVSCRLAATGWQPAIASRGQHPAAASTRRLHKDGRESSGREAGRKDDDRHRPASPLLEK